MDSKNVILAVVFSTIVLVFWGTFFAPPEMEREIQNNTTNQIEEGSSPSIEDEGIKNLLFTTISSKLTCFIFFPFAIVFIKFF